MSRTYPNPNHKQMVDELRMGKAPCDLRMNTKKTDHIRVDDSGAVKTSPQDLLKELLAVNAGVALGEMHDERESRQFLIDQIPKLAAQGVTTLFMEAFFQREQPQIDQYMKATPFSEDERNRKRKLVTAVQQHCLPQYLPSLYVDVLETAKRHDIRVVGLEDLTHTSYENLVARNAIWAQKIQEVMGKEPTGKFVFYGGCDHISYDYSARFNFSGLDEMLNIPSIELRAVSDVKTPVSMACRHEAMLGRFGEDMGNVDFFALFPSPEKETIVTQRSLRNYIKHAKEARTPEQMLYKLSMKAALALHGFRDMQNAPHSFVKPGDEVVLHGLRKNLGAGKATKAEISELGQIYAHVLKEFDAANPWLTLTPQEKEGRLALWQAVEIAQAIALDKPMPDIPGDAQRKRA